MVIYLGTIIILFLFGFIEVYYKLSINSRKIMFFSAILILVLQSGLRWETGTDWTPYLKHFQAPDVFKATAIYNRMEIGYSVLVWLIKLITSQFTIFLILYSIIYYYLIINNFEEYTPFLYVALLIFYCSSIGMLGSNRQLLALATCLIALKYAINKDPVKFFLIVILASMFHISAILFAIYYFINYKFSAFTVSFVLVLSFLIGYFQLPVYIFSYFGKLIGGATSVKIGLYLYEAKELLMESKLSISGLVKRLVLLSIFLYNRNKMMSLLSHYNVLLNGYIVGIILYFLFERTLVIMVSRGSLFFNIMEPLLLSSQLLLFKNPNNRLIYLTLILIFSITLFFQSISAYPDHFLPYKGIFINFDFQRSLI